MTTEVFIEETAREDFEADCKNGGMGFALVGEERQIVRMTFPRAAGEPTGGAIESQEEHAILPRLLQGDFSLRGMKLLRYRIWSMTPAKAP